MTFDAKQFRAVHPVLGVTNAALAAEFYTRLGFSATLIDASYAVVTRDDVELHLQWNDAAGLKEGVDQPMYRFLVRDVDLLFNEYQPLGVFHDRTALRDTPWGTREFAFYDPDGNGLTFYKPLSENE